MSITLVTVTREPLDILLRFVAWHRRIGVDRIVIYFDDPTDPAIDFLAPVDFVSCIPCTPDFWARVRQTPETRFVRRQVAALTHGYRHVRDGWVAVADADELFDLGGRLLPDVLADQPAGLRGLRIKTAEVLQTDEPDGLPRFRSESPPRIVDQLYGDAAVMLRRNRGLVGHRDGKSITRAGQKIQAMRQHFAVAAGWQDMTDALLGPAEGARLLHFFDRGYASWRAKLAWRLGAWGFPPELADVLRPLLGTGDDAVADEAGLQALYLALHHADAGRLAGLRAAGALYEPAQDHMQPAREMFPAAFADRLS